MTTSADLRSLQAPLKQRYRDDPTSASTPLQADGTFDEAGITTTVGSWAGPVRAGLHAATGGDGADACSGDMLLEALIACAGVTCRSVATAMGVPVASARIRALSSFDARGTLGIDREAPVGVGPITVTIELETDADEATLAKLATLTERYCVVGQSLRSAPEIVVRAMG